MLTSQNRVNNIYLTFFICVFLVLLIYPFDINIYWDQSVYLLHSQYFAGIDIGYDELVFRSPLLSLLTSPLWLITNKIIFFKIISILFSVYLVWISFKYFCLFTKRNIALLSALLLLSSGLLQFESRFFLTDIPSLAFFITSLYFIEKVKNHINPFNAPLAGIFLSLMLLTRLGLLYFIPLIFLYIFSLKWKKKEYLYFILGFVIIYLPYGLWIFFHYGSFFENILRAKTEGYNNASYSFLKLKQIYSSIGLTPFLFILFSLKKIHSLKNYLLFSLIIVITLFIIPYNPENNRFLLPALPFVYLLISYSLFKIKSQKLFLFTALFICAEHSYKFNFFRKKLNFHQDKISLVERIVSKIPPSESVIYTNFLYPEIAFRSKKKTIVPKLYGHDFKDFIYIDKAILSKPGVIITNYQDDFTPSYLLNKKEFTVLEKVNGFYIIKFSGFKNSSKQLKLFWLRNKWDKKAKGKGFLEIKDNKIKNLAFTYYPNLQFVEKYKLSTCLSHINKINFTHPDDYLVNIQNQSNESIWIEFIPKKIGTCVYNGASFLLRFDYLKQ